MLMSRLPLATESVTFSFQQGSTCLPKDISVSYSYVNNDERMPIDTLGILGLGNEGQAASRAARRAGRLGLYGVAIAGALPYWKATPTDEGIRKLACESTAAIAQDITEKHQPEKLHAFGESQGGPAVLEAAADSTALLTGSIALLRPLGFQGSLAIGDFAKRMIRTGLQLDQLQSPYGAVVGAHALRRFSQDAWQHNSALFNFALNYSGLPALETLIAQGRKVAVIGATNDLVFPPHELRQTLDGVSELLEIPGSHSTLASRAGAKQLPAVVNWCRTGALAASTTLMQQP